MIKHLVPLLGLAVSTPAWAQNPVDLDGPWTCTEACRCSGASTRDASIVQSGEYVLMRNECGDVSTGLIKGRRIEALKWKAVGAISENLKNISWPGGATWARSK